MHVSAVQPFFSHQLVDLSQESEKYKAVYSPQPEIGAPRMGVTAEFLQHAESYFQKYQSYDYIFGLIKRELEAFALHPSGIAVDLGCGFGNTIIPVLEHYPDLNVIGVDISPDLLAILNRETSRRALDSRCVAIAMDAQRDYFMQGFADIVFGGAVLHHMIDPEKVVRIALKTLKPGGHAIFFEPFENGHAILRIAYDEIAAQASRRKAKGKGLDFLAALRTDIAVRTHRDLYPGYEQIWPNLDDKWMFTPTYFRRVAKDVGARDVIIKPLHDLDGMFSRQARVALTQYGGLPCPECLPAWAWEILARYDNLFSQDMKEELIIEGSIVFVR